MLWTALALIYGLGLGAMLHACLTAPEGWEDADGFHLGRPAEPFDDAAHERADAPGSAESVSLHAGGDNRG